MLQNFKKEKKVIGTKQVKRAISSGDVKLVYIAQDVDSHISNDLIELCVQKSIEVVYVDSMKELGLACGIDVSAATAAILK